MPVGVDNRVEAIRIGTSTPCTRLTRLLSDKIETVEPGFGIELMRLAATLFEPLRARQTITSLVDEPDEDVVRSDRQQTKLTPS